jgi:hypothetical protein
MPARHFALPFLVAALASQVPLDDALAGQGSTALTSFQASERPSVPDEARIASDLSGLYRIEARPALGLRSGHGDHADSTAIRSSVRKGDVLEFWVTTVYAASPKGAPQREVDSIVSYRKQDTGWTLLGVKPGATRKAAPNRANASGDC